MTKRKKEPGYAAQLFHTFNRRLLAGLFVAAPIYVTYLAIRFLFIRIDGFSQPIVGKLIGYRVPGLGFILTFILLYILGLFASNVLGRSFLKGVEALLLKLPVIKAVYSLAKEIVETVSLPSKKDIKRVVYFEYPRKGLWAIGFVTNASAGSIGEKKLLVFVPSPPNPATGQLVVASEEDVTDTDLTIEEAAKIFVSGGFLGPKEVKQMTAAKER